LLGPEKRRPVAVVMTGAVRRFPTGGPFARRTALCSLLMSWSGWRRARDRDRPHLENCTVDASIFVAKLIRAHGGCLGTRSR
jgi:hypothetical protein